MANWGANHGVLTIGHVGADFITRRDAAYPGMYAQRGGGEDLPSFRWAAHGMDIEGRDYRACQNYGPLYKR